MGIKEEITKIAVEQGYEGAKPKSIAQAIDALTDTLAGEDVSSGRSVVDAIRKYAPYVGSGGGGTTLGALAVVRVIEGGNSTSIRVSTTPYDIMSGETYDDVSDSVYNNTNVLSGTTEDVNAPSGCYVVIETVVQVVEWTTDWLTVYDGSQEQQITSGFECKVFKDSSSAHVFFTMQIPADGLAVNFFGNAD